ncbi:hypothetical protein NGRA_2822 [Nosema granulosis]|uniref:Myb-like domain-containing protein n=1 Tax=Nosema granulosis TaxID=83296 RepID=A0A9P6GWP6_9MICR|nr:hypothetical protein NGRA_2822 [Nosema granulosis]
MNNINTLKKNIIKSVLAVSLCPGSYSLWLDLYCTPVDHMHKRKKKTDCIIIEPVKNNPKDAEMLQKTVEYFRNHPFSIQDDSHTHRNIGIQRNRQSVSNMRSQGTAQGHSFDLIKQANEKYNALRNTVLLEILEKYKKNDNSDFLSYEYLFKSIHDSCRLLDEYDTKTYDPDIPKSVYIDNKIRVHNMVMKLICGSKQIDHSPTSMVVALPDDLGNIISHYHKSGMFNERAIYTEVMYEREDKSISYGEIDRMAKEIDEEPTDVVLEDPTDVVLEEDTVDLRISEIARDSRYLLFLKRTSPTMLKLCESTEEYIVKQEEIIKDKGKANEAIGRGRKLGKIKGLRTLDGISPIEDVRWSKRDLKKFSSCVIKFKNNFSAISEELPHIPMADLIKKYYLAKDKTYAHIKKKPGRISDTEIKKIVESEWTQTEINIFTEKYKTYGKNLLRYQSWINKPEKDLKIFLRYFLKQQKNPKPENVHRTSLSKEDLLSNWSIDERQIFAIYFPYFNKNWITMATYFPKKTSADLKLYYSKYFKSLSFNEQKFEASISNLKVKFRTFPVIHIGDETHADEVLESIGLIFKR